jgi:hypothetical protein
MNSIELEKHIYCPTSSSTDADEQSLAACAQGGTRVVNHPGRIHCPPLLA